MTKGELIELSRVLYQVIKLSGAKFAYGVKRNIDLTKPEIEALDKAMAPSEDFMKLQEEFESQRIEIVEKYANKDSEGKPLKKMAELNGKQVEVYDMDPEKSKISNEECESAMKAKNPEVYEARLKQLKDYEEILKEEVKVAFFPYTVNLSEVPDGITGIQMNFLVDAGIIVEK